MTPAIGATMGNLSANDGVISARREQSVVYTPPSGSAICAVRPAIQANQGGITPYIQYDDSAMLVYNGCIVLNELRFVEIFFHLLDGMQKLSLGCHERKRGLTTSLWEWGNGTDVDLQEGFISTISIQNNKMNQVNNVSVANNEFDFTWVTFGDNDSIYNSGDGADCWHTDVVYS